MEKPNLYIEDQQTKKQYELREGIQIIGRKDDLNPDIELETVDLFISRKHIVLNVVRTPYSTWNCEISNYETPTNPVIVEGEELKDGDKVSLEIGESFLLGYTEFKLLEK